jgi:mRNA interferase HicA
MKRRHLIQYIERHGCEFFREGKRHSIYWNPREDRTTAIPRHTEVVEELVWKICRDLGIPRPK